MPKVLFLDKLPPDFRRRFYINMLILAALAVFLSLQDVSVLRTAWLRSSR